MTDLELGDRVALNGVLTCGSCRWCQQGETTQCPSMAAIGFAIDGGLAERLVWAADHVVKLPDNVSSEEAALVGAALSGIEGATVVVTDVHQPYEATVIVAPGRVEGHSVALEFGLGLCVVGTALNPTSRVDRQLRGRAGRQGAFGASKLLVSAQDNPIAFSRQASSLAELVVLAPPTNGGRVS